MKIERPMEGFISQVAKSLYQRYGSEISSINILFPSRRARLFFADTLSQIATKPLWQPHYTSIDELMEQLSDLKTGDPIRLITELYKIYSTHHPKETIDSFYFWGETLLSDFDSIDKYLVDADILFSNIADLKDMDSSLSYLTEDQIEIIMRFWQSFGANGEFSKEKHKFITVWKSLAPIYHSYKEILRASSYAYTGMIYRDAVQRIEAGEVDGKLGEREQKFVIAGFNALSKCEKRLFKHLKKSYDVEFFWDYDHYYLDDNQQEAGLFMRENIADFPQKTTLPYSYLGFSAKKNMVVISSPSESLQCKYVAEFLKDIETKTGQKPDKETAIVLTDENLLIPVIHSIPESIERINVTMGYPLKLTLAYSFVERLITLQSGRKERAGGVIYYHTDVLGLLNHPFIVELLPKEAREVADGIAKREQIYVSSEELLNSDGAEIMNTLFQSIGRGWADICDYILGVISEVGRMPKTESNGCQAVESRWHENSEDEYVQRIEYLSIITENIRKIKNTLQGCDIEISTMIFTSLLRKIVQHIKIPYSGEPLEGVQIMGILESRNIDFKNVIILSMNDDKFPGNRVTSPSFIPYNLRFPYGLPTPQHHEGVYAYYFYRLLQRAQNVHLVYNSQSDDKSSGEQSRYIYQLEYESLHDIDYQSIGLNVNMTPHTAFTRDKNTEVMAQLEQFLSPRQGGDSARTLSPTAFYNYMTCPLKFYLYSLARIRVDSELSEEIEAPMFGTILHNAIESLYAPLIDQDGVRAQLRSMIGSEEVEQAVEDSLRKNYYQNSKVSHDDFSGNILLIKEIAMGYINRCILEYDSKRDEEFKIIETEKRVGCQFEFQIGGEKRMLNFGGEADRIDRMQDGTIRIIDYKTGSNSRDLTVFEGMERVFEHEQAEKHPSIIQTMLYSMMVNRSAGIDVQPNVYYVRDLNKKDYSPMLLDKSTGAYITSYREYREEFELGLKEIIEEIYNPDIPFKQCEDEKRCQYCDFKKLCRRGFNQTTN